MKFFSLTISLLFPVYAFSALNMKPGLWNMEMTIMADGKEMNPSAEMEKMMNKLPEAQRKLVLESMGKASVNANNGTQVCFTSKMIKDPKSMMDKESEKCDVKLISNTPKEMVTSFKCPDGARGEGVWTAKDPQNLVGKVKVFNKKGKESVMNYKGTFLKNDCGHVKPVNQ
jgi:hypothetical protein